MPTSGEIPDASRGSGLDEGTLQWPIADFIDAQGTTNIWQPYGDEIAWAENPNQFDTPFDVTRYVIECSVDQMQWDSIGTPWPPNSNVF